MALGSHLSSESHSSIFNIVKAPPNTNGYDKKVFKILDELQSTFMYKVLQQNAQPAFKTQIN